MGGVPSTCAPTTPSPTASAVWRCSTCCSTHRLDRPPVAVDELEEELGEDDELLVSPGRPPGTLTLTVDFTKAARPIAAGIGVVRSVQPLDLVVRSVQHGVDLVSSLSRQMVVTGGPLSPLRGRHPTTSHIEVMSVAGTRRAALALGGSRNDLLVAAVAAALGDYHEQTGWPCGELRLALPTSRRHDRTAAGNWFTLTRIEVPTDGTHPAPQFGIVSERLARARTEPAVRYTDALAGAINRLPARVLIPALQAQAGSIDFVTTAVPGHGRRRPHLWRGGRGRVPVRAAARLPHERRCARERGPPRHRHRARSRGDRGAEAVR